MKTKNILGVVLAVGILMAGVAVMAENGGGSDLNALHASESPKASKTPKPSPKLKPTPSPVAVACVANAVSVRETALGTAYGAYTTAVQSAYNVRKTALATAYTKTTYAEIKAAVKAAWSAFDVSTRTITKTWQLVQKDAWSVFKTSTKACGVPSLVNDGGNRGHEMKGN